MEEQEKRQFRRVNVSFNVVYRVDSPLYVRMSIGDKEFDAVTQDISEGGIAVLTKYTYYRAIPAFTIVSIKFTIQNQTALRIEDRFRSIEVKGEVRSSLFIKEKNAYRLGISFIGLSKEERSFLRDLVKMI